MARKTIEEFLKMGNLPITPGGPSYLVMEIVCEEDNLKQISADLFGKRRLCFWLKPENAASYVKEVTFYSHKERKTAYLKECWEGGIREAFAIELNNMLTGRRINYKLYDEKVIATESVLGQILCNIELNPQPKWYSGEYGMLEEFSRVIGLADRRKNNIICTTDKIMSYSVKPAEHEFELWNIDFGHSFHHDSRLLLKDIGTMIAPESPEAYISGKEAAQNTIKANMENNFKKLAEMLAAIDEEGFKEIQCGNVLTPGEIGTPCPAKIYHPGFIIGYYALNNGWTDLAKEIGLIHQRISKSP